MEIKSRTIVELDILTLRNKFRATRVKIIVIIVKYKKLEFKVGTLILRFNQFGIEKIVEVVKFCD